MRVFLSLAQNLPPQSRYRLLKTVNEYIVINDYTEKYRVGFRVREKIINLQNHSTEQCMFHSVQSEEEASLFQFDTGSGGEKSARVQHVRIHQSSLSITGRYYEVCLPAANQENRPPF